MVTFRSARHTRSRLLLTLHSPDDNNNNNSSSSDFIQQRPVQWLEDALKENEPGSCFIFLVGTKKDLVSQAECERTENDAIKMASEMHAEYWSVSAKTGENVQGFFFRLAAIAFEESILKDLEKSNGTAARIGEGDLISKGFVFFVVIECLTWKHRDIINHFL
ncbi:UNVERIFIED_CONTAM: hypothetical protein FKN15_054603 [Acipenser sinensis]